jgi:signal transduction histidine kinase
MNNHQIDFKLNLTDAPATAYYDEERLIQVINNLISNAIKFCAGQIELTVSEVEQQLKIQIYNNGKPIAEDELEAIFDKFYQAQNQNIKKPIGSGLGLAITQ